MKKENKIILLIIIFVTTFSCMIEPTITLESSTNVDTQRFYFGDIDGYVKVSNLLNHSYDIEEVVTINQTGNIIDTVTNITTNNYFTNNVSLVTNSGEYLVATNDHCLCLDWQYFT